MKRNSCSRWIAVGDARAVGRPVTANDIMFADRHEATCASCAGEADVWRSLGKVLSGSPAPSGIRLGRTSPGARTPTLPDDDSALERILREAPGPTKTWKRRVRRRARAWTSAVAACASVAIVVGFYLIPPHSVRSPAPIVGANQNNVVIGPEGGCRDLGLGVTACFSPGAEIRTERLEGPHRVLDLVRGRVVASLLPQAPGNSFGIATAAGTVTAIGTTFAVEVDGDGKSTTARVEHGEVAISRTSEAAPLRLKQDEVANLDVSSAPSALSLEDRERDLALLHQAPGVSAGTMIHESGHAAPSPVSVDDDSAPHPARFAPASSPHSPGQGLARGRALRMSGDFRGAAAVYRSVYAADSASLEGKAALVSLGDLLLSELGDPSGALVAFDKYLSHHDRTLARQAAYGRVRALRALGRAHDARVSAEAFLVRYPAGPEAEALRRDLRALREK